MKGIKTKKPETYNCNAISLRFLPSQASNTPKVYLSNQNKLNSQSII